MLEQTLLEQRLNSLEKTVAELQHQMSENKIVPISTASHWLDCVVGSISDDSAFLQALEYGRLYRQKDTFLDDIPRQ